MGIASPKIVAEVAELSVKPPLMTSASAGIFQDLNLLTPVWYENLVKKYMDVSFARFFDDAAKGVSENLTQQL